MIWLIFLLMGAAVWFWYYRVRIVHRPRMHYLQNNFHMDVISRCSVLRRAFYPTFWCTNRHLQILMLYLFHWFTPRLVYDRKDFVSLEDGGTTAVFWSGLRCEGMAPDTPTAVILHTICGDEQGVRDIVRHIQKQLGWRVAVCVRRGHTGLPLTIPVFNTMGSTGDLIRQLDFIRKQFPQSPLFGVGLSAGSGLLVRYLGEMGDDSLFQAGVAVCPGYDIEKAFHRVHPFYNWAMRRKLVKYFLRRHRAELEKFPGFTECLRSTSVAEFHDWIYALAGYSTKEEFYAASNPILVVEGIKAPLLIVNAGDDPICVEENVREHIPLLNKFSNVMLVTTERGSHCAFFEGIFPKSWVATVICEYLQAVGELREAVPAGCGAARSEERFTRQAIPVESGLGR